jgi:hypothetical protein
MAEVEAGEMEQRVGRGSWSFAGARTGYGILLLGCSCTSSYGAVVHYLFLFCFVLFFEAETLDSEDGSRRVSP